MFKGLLDKAPTAILVSSISNGEVLYANHKLADMAGLPIDELIGRKTPNFYEDPSDRARALEALQTPGKIVNFELHVKRADGKPDWVETSCKTITYEGEPAIFALFIDITERKPAEELQSRHAQILDQIHDSVVSTDVDGIVTTWNTAAERMFGYVAKEAIGRHISFVYPGEEWEFLKTQVIEPTMRNGWHEVEVRMRRKSGEDFFAHLSDSVLRDANDKVIGRIGYAIGVTERKRAEAELKESEEHVRGILENVADGVITMTEDGEIQSFNPAAEMMFSYTASEIIGHPVTKLMIGSDCSLHKSYVDKYLQDGKGKILGVGTRELSACRKDGSTFPIGLAVGEMQSGDRRLFIGSVRDITLRKQAQDEVARKSALLQDTLDNMGQGLIVFDKTLTILATSPRARELLNLPEELLAVGADFGKLIEFAAKRGDYGPGKLETIVRRNLAMATGTEPHAFDRVVPGVLSLEARAIPRSEGGFVITYTDITERKRAKEALHEALVQAETANRSKSEFLANMSHELRTPLNAVIGFSEMIEAEQLGPLGNPSYREYARTVHESGKLLLSLIEDILDLCKIEAGKLELREEEVNVAEVVGACRRIIEGRANEAGLALETRLTRGLPRLWVDERSIKQIVLNLLSNAVKFTPKGGRVALNARIDEEGRYAIVVSDTGIGMAAEDIPKVLTPFSQVASYLTRDHQGTGLGLPLANSLVEAHGGTLLLESEPGVGTTATITFPAERTIDDSAVTSVGNVETGAA